MDRSLSLGQRTNGEPPSLGDTTNAYRNLGEWRTELRRKSPWLDLKAKERQPVAISSRPEHWWTGEHGARDGRVGRRGEGLGGGLGSSVTEGAGNSDGGGER